jgi:hypothetical protein
MVKVLEPTIKEAAFNCPHCGVLTHQFWWQTSASRLEKGKLPAPWQKGTLLQIKEDQNLLPEQKKILIERIECSLRGEISVDQGEHYNAKELDNLWLSECYTCKKMAVWIRESLVFPNNRTGPDPNVDIPTDIARDYDEARSILNFSPRGSAALLRLCIQKICWHLGCDQKNTLDQNIAELVEQNLDIRIQQALDVVRVVGNNAVHPGTIDLKDDYETAQQLFKLVNLIAEVMITQPKHVKDMYESLPEGVREAIEKRNKKASAQ